MPPRPANRYSSSMPSQNRGTAYSTSEPLMLTLSNRLPRFQPARMPMRMPTHERDALGGADQQDGGPERIRDDLGHRLALRERQPQVQHQQVAHAGQELVVEQAVGQGRRCRSTSGRPWTGPRPGRPAGRGPGSVAGRPSAAALTFRGSRLLTGSPGSIRNRKKLRTAMATSVSSAAPTLRHRNEPPTAGCPRYPAASGRLRSRRCARCGQWWRRAAGSPDGADAQPAAPRPEAVRRPQ